MSKKLITLNLEILTTLAARDPLAVKASAVTTAALNKCIVGLGVVMKQEYFI
jgi:hypothetical protein